MSEAILTKTGVSWVDFNINSRVRVKLTNEGRAELRRQAADLRKTFPRLGEFDPVREDKDGWMEMQLWSLMESLGHMCHIGFSGPFETAIQFEVSND